MSEFAQDVMASLDGASPDSSSGNDVNLDSSSNQNNPAQEERVPWGKDPRWIKWQQEERPRLIQYEQENNQYKNYIQQNAQAVQFWQALQQDPNKLKAVVDLLTQTPKPAENPYADYDPLIAKKLQDYDAMMERLNKLEGSWEQNQTEMNVQSLDSNFDQLCASAQITSQPHQQAMASLTYVELQKIMGNRDIRTASPQEQAIAFQRAMPIMKSIRDAERRGLEIPSLPPSGSRTGVAPRQETWGSDRDRIEQMVSDLF